MPHEPTCGSLFSGAGLLDAGLSLAGWEHAWLCESVPERRDLLRARFPGARVFDDVRTLRGPFAADAECDAVRQQSVAVGGRGGATVAGRAGEAATDAASGPTRRDAEKPAQGLAAKPRRSDGLATRVDLIAGGFPCKGVSGAGKQNGFEHAESFLWYINAMRESVPYSPPRPRRRSDMSDPPRGALPPGVEKAARRIHLAVWGEHYAEGRGPMHHAGGPYWPNRLLSLADSWERMAVAARVCSAHMTAPGPDDTHDWRDDDIVLGVSPERFCWACASTESSPAGHAPCTVAVAVSPTHREAPQ